MKKAHAETNGGRKCFLDRIETHGTCLAAHMTGFLCRMTALRALGVYTQRVTNGVVVCWRPLCAQFHPHDSPGCHLATRCRQQLAPAHLQSNLSDSQGFLPSSVASEYPLDSFARRSALFQPAESVIGRIAEGHTSHVRLRPFSNSNWTGRLRTRPS